jgi:tetratricopeptide (TPR) repeat protein
MEGRLDCRRRRPGRRGALLATLAVASVLACAGPSVSRVSNADKLRLDGAVVRTTPDPLTQLETYDPPLLFHLALQAEQTQQPERAEQIYQRLLAEFPESTLANPARFNLGLVLEARSAWEVAAAQYTAIAEQEPPEGASARRTWVDSHFRLAVCAGKLGDWWRAVVAFDYLLGESWLSDADRLEALVGKGIATQEGGEPLSAEVVFSQALRFFTELTDRVGRFDDRGLAAEAAFRMGEIARGQFSGVALALPEALLMERLEAKCEYLLSAQSRYLRAIRYGDAHTVAAAGLRIGSLYETLYDEVIALETPPELDAEETEVYQEEVRKKVNILVKKALIAYERSLEVGRRAPTAGEWVARLEAAVTRLQRLYLEESVVE